MMTLPKASAVLILNKDNINELVAVSRRENPELLGLPGGKADAGETSLAAMLREVYEETGVTLNAADAVPLYTALHSGYLVTTYVIEVDYIDSFTPPELDMLPKWVSKEVFLANTAFPAYNTAVFDTLSKILT